MSASDPKRTFTRHGPAQLPTSCNGPAYRGLPNAVFDQQVAIIKSAADGTAQRGQRGMAQGKGHAASADGDAQCACGPRLNGVIICQQISWTGRTSPGPCGPQFIRRLVLGIPSQRRAFRRGGNFRLLQFSSPYPLGSRGENITDHQGGFRREP